MLAPFLALLAALQAPADQQPGEVTIFGDWAVGCDNGLACEAISLPPEDWSAGNAALLTVRRGPGADGYLRVGLYVYEETRADRLTLSIDGEIVASFADSGDALRFEATGDLLPLLARIANGAEARLATADGEAFDRLSLAGSSAALRFIDDRQQRAGTRGAAVARGDRPDSTLPAPPAVPAVTRRLASDPDRAVAPLGDGRAMALHLEHDCDGIDDELRRDDVLPLDDARELILISCWGGAYNFSDLAFVREGATIAPARFDRIYDWGEGMDVPVLVNADWSAEDGILSTYAKGRGIGDCGTAESFVWDGAMFRLIERREMTECRGSPHWITVWRAEAVPSRD